MNGKHLLAGAFAGVVVVLLVLILLNQRENSQPHGSHPQMTSYNVVRDDQGRIQSVDTLSGLSLNGQQQQQPEKQVQESRQTPAPRQTLRN